ncbi:hypothetical protein L2E82_31558 [Cichorium intybus]|uniref:Uncharacterized protein n=1 Tax=Cichorium intybus TaxID=13427 RepID=A0ACB9BDI9_CICIN|nr:hypothetical protein L2E82_31558 [Cichorium intybus]
MNELAEMWEGKIGKKLENIYVTEEELLKKIKDYQLPSLNIEIYRAQQMNKTVNDDLQVLLVNRGPKVEEKMEKHAAELSATITDYDLINAEKFRFNAEFIEMRRQALDSFVNRIALHHELQKSEDLRTFLQADEQSANAFRQQCELAETIKLKEIDLLHVDHLALQNKLPEDVKKGLLMEVYWLEKGRKRPSCMVVGDGDPLGYIKRTIEKYMGHPTTRYKGCIQDMKKWLLMEVHWLEKGRKRPSYIVVGDGDPLGQPQKAVAAIQGGVSENFVFIYVIKGFIIGVDRNSMPRWQVVRPDAIDLLTGAILLSQHLQHY